MSPRPAIVQLIGSFQGGGAQRLALNLAEALAAKGHRSVAIALRRAGSFAHLGRTDEVELHVLNANRESRASVLRAALALRRVLRRTNAAALHVHGSGCVVVAALAVLAWRGRPRLVFTWHDSGSVVGGRGLKRAITLWALRRCDALYGSSRDVADRLRKVVGTGATVEVFINGVPERPVTAAQDDPVARMIWLGRLVPVKDPELLLRALDRVRQASHGGEAQSLAAPAFECTLAGAALPHGAAFEQRCRELHAALGLTGSVLMPGWVDDTAGLIGRSNIGVQSSRSEGLSMALLEQMMAGLAVVATDVGDTARAVVHERTGLLVPPGDGGALAEALLRLTQDPALRRRLGEAARAKALTEFSLAAMADRAAGVYGQAGARL